jgi:hypothetical protein
MSIAHRSEALESWPDHFLVDHDSRTWRGAKDLPGTIKPAHLFLQSVDNGLEVAAATSSGRPKPAELRKAWKSRQGGRAAPVLLAVGYETSDGMKVATCGPVGEEPLVLLGLDHDRLERVASAALDEPDRHCAQRSLLRALHDVESDLLGLVNGGLLATHELRSRVPERPDWSSATKTARPLLRLRGRQLVKALGYSIDTLTTDTSLLTVGRDRRAVAVFLDDHELPDNPADRFGGSTPVSRAMALAGQQGVRWVVMTRAAEIRLYAATPSVGVGRKSGEATFVEVNLRLLPGELAGYLQLLFSSEALASDGSLEEIIQQSKDFAVVLANRLRERVYREAVPALASAVACRLAPDPDETTLAAAYDQTLNILFRLLFVAYGEDKGLLPYRTNEVYTEHSLKSIAHSLLGLPDAAPIGDDGATDLWDRVAAVWHVIDEGDSKWGVPAYNGGLFSETSPVGAALARLRLTNAEFQPVLQALTVDFDEDDELGPVDFRSLSVREFGTLYEGLLESNLSVASSDLALDSRDTYVPAIRDQQPVVLAGSVYLHNRSGARKATGSYFTKPFAVDHLLDQALEPALDDHVSRIRAHLDRGDEAAAASEFFDFRCADIAMGSGHFLVAAIDRIEARLSGFLALNPVPHIVTELDQLREVAKKELGSLAEGIEIETTALLRRQIARRCIYGVDCNEISVELARLAIWLHTFVPGLPLSFLDHNLVRGDSLTGIGTVEEALAALPAGSDTRPTVFREQILGLLSRSSKALDRLATTADATIGQVKDSERAHWEAHDAVQPAAALFDLIVAERLGHAEVPLTLDEAHLLDAVEQSNVRKTVDELGALHFPIAFPEVFIRQRSGFDCILGNPPWEEATVEELGFWALRFPGLKSLKPGEQKREIVRLRSERLDLVAEYEAEVTSTDLVRRTLTAGPYPGMGKGDPDLYKAFCWRFWDLTRHGGAIGVVLPRSALSAAGSAPWRASVLDEGCFADVTMTLNTAGWVFDEAEHRYTIGLVSLRKGADFAGLVSLRGPFSSLGTFLQGLNVKPAEFPVDEFRTWSDGAAFPLLPSAEAATVFTKLRRHPRLDAADQRERASSGHWHARPVTEFHATADKHLFELAGEAHRQREAPLARPGDSGPWPVYKGASFNLWEPDTGVRYGTAEPDVVLGELQRKRLRQNKLARSAFNEFPREWARDPSTLPCLRPRIAFRDIARATDTRTVIAALVPGHLVITNKAPYLLWPEGDERDEAYLLGVLSSMPLDWCARRVIEITVNFHIFNGLPVPRPDRDHPLRRRVEEIAGRLAAVDGRYAEWAGEVGVPVGSVTDEEKAELLAELDAAVGHLYGLDEDDLKIIYGTFHEGADYSERCERVLVHHRRLA